MILVSLCIPTNGVVEWVFPVLDSIYSQEVDNKMFEVIITDNGNNTSFKKRISEYMLDKHNLIYTETDAEPFVNEIEAYKRATGHLIKFVNHRTKLKSGTLRKLIEFSERYYHEKPIIYFSNGVLKLEKKQIEYKSFDEFVQGLSYWSSWSTGMTLWNDDFTKLNNESNEPDELFPHTKYLFGIRDRDRYIIDNTIIFDEISPGSKPKGKYDLFFAFGVVYPSIILKLFVEKSITKETYSRVLKENLGFIAKLYYDYVVLKEYCSYDLSGIENIYDVFYAKSVLLKEVSNLHRCYRNNAIRDFVSSCMNKIHRRSFL